MTIGFGRDVINALSESLLACFPQTLMLELEHQLFPAPTAGERFFAKWQGAFKLNPAALKDERVAAIMAKHVR